MIYYKAIIDPSTSDKQFNDYDMRKHYDYDNTPMIEWLKSCDVLNELKTDKYNKLSNFVVYERLTRLDLRVDGAPWLIPLFDKVSKSWVTMIRTTLSANIS